MPELLIDGIVPIIPTPFLPDEAPDWEGLENLLEFAIAAGGQAVCLPAYASEFYKLSEDERHETVAVAVRTANGRVPVIAQVNYPSARQSIAGAVAARKHGAAAICCAVPRIFALSEADLLEHFHRVLESVDLPFIIQDFNPGGASLSPGFITNLHRQHSNFRYVKLEEPLMAAKVQAILNETGGEVGVLEGWGGMFLLELVDAGIAGVMPGLAVTDILGIAYRFAKSGLRDEAYDVFQRVLPQIVYSLQNMELFHHAEKRLLVARGVLARSVVRRATITLRKQEADHIDFLNAKVLETLDKVGLPRNPAKMPR